MFADEQLLKVGKNTSAQASNEQLSKHLPSAADTRIYLRDESLTRSLHHLESPFI